MSLHLYHEDKIRQELSNFGHEIKNSSLSLGIEVRYQEPVHDAAAALDIIQNHSIPGRFGEKVSQMTHM